jgi:hypothetical protein
MWDNEIAEVFDLWGGETIARYFEAIRYRQQLTPNEMFAYRAADIKKVSGLSYKKQLHAKKVLVGSGWLETQRVNDGNGTKQCFVLTALAKEATSHIPHRRDTNFLRTRFQELRGMHFSGK